VRFFGTSGTLVHFQHGHLWFNLALPLLNRYPLVLTIHDPRHHLGDRNAHKTPQMIMDLGYHRADQVIVHGGRLKQLVVDELHLPAEAVHVIPHIVLGDNSVHNQIQEADHLVLFFGRIWEYKGLDYLIRAEPLITAEIPDARIVIAGQGEDFARYRRMMVHPERFIVHNEYVSNDKRAELFQRASVVALPYVDASQSGVIPIAYTFAKPVVATAVGALPEMVEPGRTGYLVPPRNEQALADAIVRLLRDRELRRQMGANGKRKIDTECSPDVVAQQTIAVYRCAIGDGRSSAGERKPESIIGRPLTDTVPECRVHFPDNGKVSLRRFPHPYRAAIAICSDIDETKTTEEFLEIQRFLNTKNATSMGEGVGLEIGNSFYFYDQEGGFSYFSHDERAQRVIIELIRAGYIDCLHTYGDAAMSRDQVLRALAALCKADCTLDVWVNHHGARTSLGRKFEYMFGECRGDDPRSDAYHADATLDYGIRFAWIGATTRLVGQSSANSSASLSTVFDLQYPLRSSVSVLKEMRKSALGRWGDERYVMCRQNRLTRPTQLEDGQRVHEFVRYCNHPVGVSHGATSRGLAYAISRRALDRLKATQGFMIVYTHLGKNGDCEQFIAPETQERLRDLERDYRNGEVYVTTTSKLLNYHHAHQYAAWSYQQTNGCTQIHIHCLDDPAFGKIIPTIEQLQGLTFYVPDSSRADIYVQGVKVKGVQRHPADDSGMASVTIPITYLSFPY
jgi:glycosyltransferase involved in cell wall biosynthesis